MKPRILLAVTADLSLRLLDGMPATLAAAGWDVHVVSSPGPGSDTLEKVAGVTVHRLPMARNPSPIQDGVALWRWVRLIRRIRPDVTSIGTPKAALLGTIAAAVCGVGARVYLVRGLRYETVNPPAALLLKTLEIITCICATAVIAVSASVATRMVSDKIAPSKKISVLGKGSSNGVDISAFSMVSSERSKHDAGQGFIPTLGYIGRLHADKGIDLLAETIEALAHRGAVFRLLVVGPLEDQASRTAQHRLARTYPDVIFTGQVDDVRPYLHKIDILCLPTKREGFPNVVLEAAASGVPSVATNATGVVDAIEDGETGRVCMSRDPQDFANLVEGLIDDPMARHEMGVRAQIRATQHFDRATVQGAQELFYRTLRNKV